MKENLSNRTGAALLVAVTVSTFLGGLDISFAGLAGPEISDEFGVGVDEVSWVSVVFTVALAGLLIAFAKSAEYLGIRRLMAAGPAVFAAGCLMCWLSPSLGDGGFAFLLAARAVEGVGAAILYAVSPICITRGLPESRLSFGFATMAVGAALGFIVGPVLGGWIIDECSWELAFLAEVPVAFVMSALVLAYAPKEERRRIEDPDVLGTVTLLAALVLGVLALEEYSAGWVLPTVCAVAAVALLVAFVFVEKGAKDPIIRTSLFRMPGFAAIFVSIMLSNAAYMGVFYLAPFYCDTVLETDATTTGVLLTVSAIATAITANVASKASDVWGRRPACVLAGVLAAIAYAIMAAFADSLTAAAYAVPMFLVGLGWSFVSGPMASRLVEHAGEDRDMASSLYNEAIHVGGAAGTAATALAFAAFSGLGGRDASSLSASDLLSGYEPALWMLVAFSVVVAVAMAIVTDRRARAPALL